MSHKVEIIADSIAENGRRLTTFRLYYPMHIHWDILTHRAISRNAESGRVISVTRRIQMVAADPFRPSPWRSDETSMRPGEPLPRERQSDCDRVWDAARSAMVFAATALADLGAHREQVNSLLIPFGHIAVIASATDWANFFALRAVPGARPELVALARDMARRYRDGTPRLVRFDEWHLPLVTDAERAGWPLPDCISASVARCARTTYTGHDGRPKPLAEEIALRDRLEASMHVSPFEHQSRPFIDPDRRSGNFRGWSQYRQELPRPVYDTFDFDLLDGPPWK